MPKWHLPPELVGPIWPGLSHRYKDLCLHVAIPPLSNPPPPPLCQEHHHDNALALARWVGVVLTLCSKYTVPPRFADHSQHAKLTKWLSACYCVQLEKRSALPYGMALRSCTDLPICSLLLRPTHQPTRHQHSQQGISTMSKSIP